MGPLFQDRREAGQRLAHALMDRGYGGEECLVLGIPRGGVVVAAEVAGVLNAPLDIVLARRLGAPEQPEVAVGAIVEEEAEPEVEEDLARAMGVTAEHLEAEVHRVRAQMARQRELFRDGRPLPSVAGRTVLVVDDGIATGATVRVALAHLRRHGPCRLVVAAPLISDLALTSLRDRADDIVFVASPDPFLAVGVWYKAFPAVAEEEIVALQRGETAVPAETLPPPGRPVTIPLGHLRLEGFLGVPPNARGVVLFAHGSGSGRESPRNAFVARMLQDAGFATLCFDLLTEDEKADRRNVFNIDLLADRLLSARSWIRADPEVGALPVGYFGASTGAGAALQAAARAPEGIGAVVSRGGRPELANDYLPRVTAPTVLLVGGEDRPVIAMNREALARLRCPNELVIVPDAGHLFEEPGAMEEVARLTLDWFERHLGGGSVP